MAINARIPLIELSEKMKCSSQKLHYRIKNLQKIGLINGFRVGIDVEKIGFKSFKVDIFLNESSKRKELWNFFRYNPYVTFINTSAGYADLEIEFTIENTDKLIELIEEVSKKYQNAIKKYTYFTTAGYYKLQCLPQRD